MFRSPRGLILFLFQIRVTVTSTPMASVLMSRELRDLSTAGLIQNFQSLLKEGEAIRFSRQELYKISWWNWQNFANYYKVNWEGFKNIFIFSILTTAEYCVETIQQLEEKLREKLKSLGGKLNMEVEKRLFMDVIETCVGLLVQDLYSACEPVLTSMHKVR